VKDLSQPETIPVRILPLLMIGSQFYLQKMTPTSGMDPTQARMMLMMPLMMGFLFYNASSGLVLYWLTGNLVGIGQQLLFNKIMATPSPPRKSRPRKKANNRVWIVITV
jgi:YidC/Oxa1 family membrane protein insertase